MRTVASSDGTPIAYTTSGTGPPLVLVHGTTADHTRWTPLLPHLEPHRTVHALDRRGRGASGDAEPYQVEREFDDVAAVIEAVAAEAGSPVDVYGHSYGGMISFKAAGLTTNVRRLVLYEGWPPVEPAGFAPDPEMMRRLDDLLARGDEEALLETFLAEVAQVPPPQLDAMRGQPSWASRVEAAHTLVREVRAYPTVPFDAAESSKLDVQVLLVLGADSPPFFRARIEDFLDALPDARLIELEGQTHVGDVLVPDVFAERVLAFLDG